MSDFIKVGRVAALAVMLTGLGSGFASAQSYDSPNLPRSPYALPQPTYREPDADELLFGNGEPNDYDYDYRHHHGSGELGQFLFAPNGFLSGAFDEGGSRRYQR